MKKLLLLLPIFLFAFVNVNVNKKNIYPGEEIIFTIEATGNDIEFPKIKDIEGFQVQGTAVTQNITILNGNMQKSISKSYIFFPTKSVTIPSFKVKIDSKTYTTSPIKITVTKPKQTKNSDFKLVLSANKANAYIGEPIIFKIMFYQKQDTSPQSIEIQKPSFTDFFTKQISKKEFLKDGYSITEYSFLLIPQKAGEHKIGPILAKVGYLSKESPFNDPFFNIVTSSLKYINIFSNQVEINISSIPQNSVYGDFKAEFSADKTTANANEPINVTLKIKGCGDIYDLPDFNLNIKDATVYENTPKIKTYIKNGKLCGTYIKEFTIIANKDVIIHPIEFKTFNGKIKTVRSNKILLHIISNNKTVHKHQVTKKIEEKIIYKTKTNYVLTFLVFIIGIIIGILITYAIQHKPFIHDENDIIRKIKKADEKELFNLLLEFSNDSRIEEILKELEENIYNGKNNKINKKEIIKIIKKIKK